MGGFGVMLEGMPLLLSVMAGEGTLQPEGMPGRHCRVCLSLDLQELGVPTHAQPVNYSRRLVNLFIFAADPVTFGLCEKMLRGEDLRICGQALFERLENTNPECKALADVARAIQSLSKLRQGNNPATP